MISERRENRSRLGRVMAASTQLFGMHLMIDAYDGLESALSNMDLCFTLLDQLPDILGMRKITTPYVVKVSPSDQQDCGGYSGFVMIATSHISLHTFPKKGFAVFDIFTCQGSLDVERISAHIKERFQFKKLELQEVKRGLHFPSPPRGSESRDGARLGS